MSIIAGRLMKLAVPAAKDIFASLGIKVAASASGIQLMQGFKRELTVLW